MPNFYYELIAAWLIVNTILLRACVDQVNRLLKPRPPIIEPSLLFATTSFTLGILGSAILLYLLPEMPLAGRVAIAVFVQWTYVGLVMKDNFQSSITHALIVFALQSIYLSALCLIIVVACLMAI